MKLSKLFGKRFKEKPSDTKLISHEFLLRGGYIRQLANGIFSHLLPTTKIILNIENIIREEMNNIGGQETTMPLVQPAELWEESGRFETIQDELLRLKDRTNHDFVLAMTHEESAVTLARSETSSYKDYPFMFYQFSKKFRDEARSRGGLIRLREFEMKDAYSFHLTQKDLEEYYEKCFTAYDNIYKRVGIKVISIKSDNGIMGGNISHEFMLITPSGEDSIVVCDKCSYKANKEVATSFVLPANDKEEEKQLEEVATPNVKTIDDLSKFLNIESTRLAKCVFYQGRNDDLVVLALIRGDLDVNDMKLSKILQKELTAADEDSIKAIGAVAGFASPIGLSSEKLTVIIDKSLEFEKNLVTGANKQDYHYKNFNIKRDLGNVNFYDIALVKDKDLCPNCKSHISIKRGIEVGNIFQLGNKYSKRMKLTYLDENNTPQTPIMGCYGIGIDRLVGSIIEENHDEDGPIWPFSVAPWKVAIVSLYQKNNTEINDIINSTSQDLYDVLKSKGLDPIWDDRDVSAGEKFADIDLLGIPIVLIISKRNLENKKIEYKVRELKEKDLIDQKNLFEKIDDIIKRLK